MGLTRRPHLGRLLPGGHDVVPGNTHTLRVLSSSFGPVFLLLHCRRDGEAVNNSLVSAAREKPKLDGGRSGFELTVEFSRKSVLHCGRN